MSNRIRLYSLWGSIYFYKWLKRFYDAVYLTWHKSVAIAMLAVFVLFSSVAVLGIALWIFAGAFARALHGDMLQGVLLFLASATLIVASKVGVNLSESLLPMKAAIDSEDDDVDF